VVYAVLPMRGSHLLWRCLRLSAGLVGTATRVPSGLIAVLALSASPGRQATA